MNWPSGVRINLLLNGVCGRTSVTAVLVVVVEAGGGVWHGKSCCEDCWVRSKMSSVFAGGLPEPVPTVEIRARPSPPTATPCGAAGSVTVCMTTSCSDR